MSPSFEEHHDAGQMLDACRYLFLRELSEPIDNQLRLVVEEAAAQGHLIPASHSDLPELQALLTDAFPILSDTTSRSFEISFHSYISYTVSDETYGRYPQTPEAFTGNVLRRFSWSHLLDFTRKTTYASDEHPGPGPLRHLEIVCLNHIIDVITTEEPRIRVFHPLRSATASVQ